MNLVKMILMITYIIFTSTCSRESISEKESNDTSSSAMLININSIIDGNFNNIQDVDFYKLVVNKPSTLSIAISGVKSFDVKIQVYRNTYSLKIVDDYLRNEGEKIDNIHFSPGTYFIKLSINKPQKELYKAIKTIQNIQYKLSIRPLNNTDEEIEPNDLPKQSITIKLGKPIFGYYSPFKNLNDESKLKKLPFNFGNKEHFNKLKQLREYDFDWYNFKIPRPGKHQIIIELENSKLVDGIIGVYQTKPLLFWNTKGIGENETIPNLTVEGEKTCYILIVGVNHHNTSSEEVYKYKLNVQVRSEGNPARETENNDSIDKANIITEGFIQGLISPQKDYDYYHLQIKSDIDQGSFPNNNYTFSRPLPSSGLQQLENLNKENSYKEELDEVIPLNPEDNIPLTINPKDNNLLDQNQDKLKDERQNDNTNENNPLNQNQDKLKGERQNDNTNENNPLNQNQDKLKDERQNDNTNENNPLNQNQDKLKDERQNDNTNENNPLNQNQDKLKDERQNDNTNENNLLDQNQDKLKDERQNYNLRKNKRNLLSYLIPANYQSPQNYGQIIHRKRKLFISITGIEKVDIELRLYDSKYKLLSVYDTNGSGEGETVNSYDVSKMKDIYILVKGGKNNSGENDKQPYKLTVKIVDYEYTPNHKEIYEVEPNGKTIDVYSPNIGGINQEQKSLPNIIYINQKVFGFINPRAYYHENINLTNDVDYYEIQLESNKTYRVTLIGVKGNRLNLRVFQAKDHRNPKIKLIVNGKLRRSKVFHNDSLDSYLDNIYHIKVASQYGKTANSNKPYALFIEEVK